MLEDVDFGVRAVDHKLYFAYNFLPPFYIEIFEDMFRSMREIMRNTPQLYNSTLRSNNLQINDKILSKFHNILMMLQIKWHNYRLINFNDIARVIKFALDRLPLKWSSYITFLNFIINIGNNHESTAFICDIVDCSEIVIDESILQLDCLKRIDVGWGCVLVFIFDGWLDWLLLEFVVVFGGLVEPVFYCFVLIWSYLVVLWFLEIAVWMGSVHMAAKRLKFKIYIIYIL